MLTTGSAPHPTPEADDSSSDCSSSPPSPSLPQPKSSLLVHCPKDAKPGTLLKTTTSTVPNTSQRSNTKYFHNTVRQHKIRKTSQYIAVPHGIQPGDQFHVPQPLTNSAVKEVLMANTAVTSNFDLEVTRSGSTRNICHSQNTTLVIDPFQLFSNHSMLCGHVLPPSFLFWFRLFISCWQRLFYWPRIFIQRRPRQPQQQCKQLFVPCERKKSQQVLFASKNLQPQPQFDVGGVSCSSIVQCPGRH